MLFKELQEFIQKKMRMSPVYQPVKTAAGSGLASCKRRFDTVVSANAL